MKLVGMPCDPLSSGRILKSDRVPTGGEGDDQRDKFVKFRMYGLYKPLIMSI